MKARTVSTLPPVAADHDPVRCLLAIELSKKSWIVAITTALSDKISRYTLDGCDWKGLLELMERVRKAKTRIIVISDEAKAMEFNMLASTKQASIVIAATVVLSMPLAPAFSASAPSNTAMQTVSPLRGGDFVRLRSGGPLMTVDGIKGEIKWIAIGRTGMARLTLKVSPSTCFRNPNRLPFRLRLQPAPLQAGYDSRAKDSGLTSEEVRRGQYPSRRAATLNKSQSQPAVATTITIDNTVRLKRLRMRYCPRSLRRKHFNI